MFLSEVESLQEQFLGPQSPEVLQQSAVPAIEKISIISVLAGDLDGKVDSDLANFTVDPGLGSRSSLIGDCARLLEFTCGLMSHSLLQLQPCNRWRKV